MSVICGNNYEMKRRYWHFCFAHTLIGNTEVAFNESNIGFNTRSNNRAVQSYCVDVHNRCFVQVRPGWPVAKHVIGSWVMYGCSWRVQSGITCTHSLQNLTSTKEFFRACIPMAAVTYLCVSAFVCKSNQVIPLAFKAHDRVIKLEKATTIL